MFGGSKRFYRLFFSILSFIIKSVSNTTHEITARVSKTAEFTKQDSDFGTYYVDVLMLFFLTKWKIVALFFRGLYLTEQRILATLALLFTMLPTFFIEWPKHCDGVEHYWSGKKIQFFVSTLFFPLFTISFFKSCVTNENCILFFIQLLQRKHK